jgi:hypothetical protein
MRYLGLALVIAFVAILSFFDSAQASRNNIRHCADDYRRFCSQWGLETRGLENCMHRHGDRLTHACIAALVRAGEVSQAEVNRRRAAHAGR